MNALSFQYSALDFTESSGYVPVVEFRILADYNTVVGADKAAFISVLKPQLAEHMNVTESRIQNMDVTSG